MQCGADDCTREAMWCGWCNAHCDGSDEHREYIGD